MKTASSPRKTRVMLALAVAMMMVAPARSADAPLPIFDAHLHYSHDAWERLSPKAAVALLRQAGLKYAMVSSSSDEGTQKLYNEAPDLVLPVLRPYRTRGEIGSWTRDPTVVAHLEARLLRISEERDRPFRHRDRRIRERDRAFR